MKVRAIVYREQGIPSSVAQLEEIELLGLQPGEVLVRMQFAPINPADLNIIEGKYPLRQRFKHAQPRCRFRIKIRQCPSA